MQSVAGVFVRRADAERATAAVTSLGIPRDRVAMLTPGADTRQVPTAEGEQPGMGAALGAVTGVATGLPVGAAVALLVPGVGPVIASGLIGATLLGTGGAAVGASLERSLTGGLPRDELFVYEDALRQGHSVVIALVDDSALADRVRSLLAEAGAESIDAARDRWWLSLRGAEQERYVDGPHAFERDEALYRCGFEAALGGAVRGRSWEDAVGELRARHGTDCDAPAFRRGWERARGYRKDHHDPDLRKTA
jgi:hypothetical protein